MPENVVEIKNVSKTYRIGSIEVQALRNVSLKISCGEFVAIMGPSGSGKSTLMHVLGLLDRPDSGEYFLAGQEISKLPEWDLARLRNRLVGFVFQQFHLLPRMSALENAELPLFYAGKTKFVEIAKKRLAEVGLSDRLKHKPTELSGGQQQRVAIARSLVNDPLIIFADEPTGNLDSKSKEEIIKLLESLHEKGKTVVVVTHEQEVASRTKRVITVRDGQIVSDTLNVKQDAVLASKIEVQCKDAFVSKSQRAMGSVKFLDYLHQAVAAMLSHKMRAFLSILGILIGVAAVIAMIALGRGAQDSIEKQLASLGSNLIMVRPGSSRVHGVAMQTGTVTRFTMQDVAAILKDAEYISRASPSVSGRGQVVYGNKNWNTQLEGVDTAYESLRSATPIEGRFFSNEEVKMRSKVVLIGATVARELFGDDNPVGKTIKVNLINFKVIGILPVRGANTFRDQDDNIIIPVTTAMYRILGKQYLDTIYIEARSPDVTDEAQSEVTKAIVKQHHLTAKEAEDSFEVRNMADIKTAMQSTTKTMSLLLGTIAAISLLVGGIGIMNIMLVSVTERTREIGLRKAIGANNKDIMTQFLIEAVLMSLIGGVLGIVVGSGISLLITLVAGWSVKLSVFPLILATVFSLAVGLIFGLWPARQAARLDPIEALRYE